MKEVIANFSRDKEHNVSLNRIKELISNDST